MFQPVKSGRLYQQIGAQICGQIQEGKIAPGEKLPPEADLAQMFNVSRATVREALIALETVGYIEVRNGLGAYVCEQLPHKATIPWSSAVEPGPGLFEQFQAREIIEPAIARIAAMTITDDELAELDRILDHMDESYQRNEKDDEDGFAFHVALAVATRNFFLANAVRDLWAMRRGQMWTTVRARLLNYAVRQEALQFRRAIVAALRRRDGNAACSAMKDLLKQAHTLFFQDIDEDQARK